jgi:hypothetical protein
MPAIAGCFFCQIREPTAAPKPKRVLIEGVYSGMKGLSIIIAAFILVFGTVTSRAANLERISAETGVPIATLQAERASTGLGWGGLEKAHLLANASGQSFDTIVGKFQGHEGWGQIAHDYGLNLGKVVSSAHRSSHATMHAQNLSKVHGKSTAVHGRSAATDHGKSATTVHGKRITNIGRGHAPRMSSTRGAGHGSSLRFSHMGSHGVSHGMGGMGHGHGR